MSYKNLFLLLLIINMTNSTIMISTSSSTTITTPITDPVSDKVSGMVEGIVINGELLHNGMVITVL